MCWVMGQTCKFLESVKMVSVGLANRKWFFFNIKIATLYLVELPDFQYKLMAFNWEHKIGYTDVFKRTFWPV